MLLCAALQVRVRFDAAEALSELQRLQLLDVTQEGSDGSGAGAYTAVAPARALEQLKTQWDMFLEGCLTRRLEDAM